MFEIIGYLLIIFSIFITITTTIGLIKFNNIYTQIHIAAISDMIGIPSLQLGIVSFLINDGNYNTALKLFIAIVFWYIVSPISSYTLIKISYFYNKKEF